ncbi:hypothetical protein ANO11243_071650 [Dothideomycetidae sp. 11243]|nr:hypothetical protein ANO11243_071650 [fungal sp. No.11243]
MQALLVGVEALYFHQGTIGNCEYCWWGHYDIGAPYYGAYFATLALAGATQIAPLDTGTNNFAGYVVYTGQVAKRVLLINSNYYSGSGARTAQSFTLTGLNCTGVTAKRLTAPASTSRQDQGQNPTLAGQTFENGTCTIQGEAMVETTSVEDGRAVFKLKASEALLVYL